MVRKQTLLKIIELVQELDKTEKKIECAMIINDMEKVFEKHTAEQLNLHSVSKSFTKEQIETAYDVGFSNGCEHARPAY